MAQRPISREYRIYLAIWRKAYLQRNSEFSEVVIRASSPNMAISMRQGMYRAIRPFRAGEIFDEDLRQAAELLVVFHDKANCQLVLRPRLTLTELEKELSVLGLDEADLLLDNEKPTGITLEEFITGPDTLPDIERPANPFYVRD